MKKLSADGSVPLNLKMPPDLGAKISETAKKSGQSNSAVIRAAIRLGLRALEVKPEMVRQIEAGTMDSGTLAEFVTRFALLCGYHVNPQTEQKRTLAAGQAQRDWLKRVDEGLPVGGGLSEAWRDAIIEDIGEILSSEPARTVLSQVLSEEVAKNPLLLGSPSTPAPPPKCDAPGSVSTDPVTAKPTKKKPGM